MAGAENPAFCIQADSHSAELFRRAVSSLMGGIGEAPYGVVGGSDLLVTAGAGNSVDTASGEVWMPGSTATQGSWYGYSDASVNKSITPNASNPLYAIVTASVNDQAYSSNPGVTNDSWDILLTAGTAAASPSVPTTPYNSLLLAKILVPANASSSASYTITDERVFTSGVIRPLTPPTTPNTGTYDGQPLLFIADAHSGNTDGFGNITVTFGTAFPNGIIACFPRLRNSASNYMSSVNINSTELTKTGFVGSVWSANHTSNETLDTYGSVVIEYFAIGF